MTEDEYANRLRDGREVYLRGERIDVTAEPSFKGVLAELDRLRAMGGTGYALPRTREELIAWRQAADTWAEESWGLLINTPDYMASAVIGLHDSGLPNAAGYYQHAAGNDLAVAHAVLDPMGERSSLYPGYEPTPGLQLDRGALTGALPLVPMAPLADEVLVMSTRVWCAVPMNAPGLKILCSDTLSAHADDETHPFAYAYNEPDATLFFDGVHVPADRVFLVDDEARHQEALARVRTWCTYSANTRTYRYLWTIVGVATMMAEAAGVDVQRGMRDKLGEIIIYPELFRSGLTGDELEAETTAGGLMATTGGLALTAFAEQYTRRILDVVREIGGAGLVQQVSEADLASPSLKPYLERHMGSEGFSASEKARLYRVAWDLLGDGGGSRKELYERWLRGDIVRVKNKLYLNYDRSSLTVRIADMISRPLPV